MTLQDHIRTAKELKKIREDLMAMYCIGPKRIKKIYKVESLRLMKIVDRIDEMRNKLEKSYCRSVDKKTFDETYDKLGSIYFGDQVTKR